MKTTKDKLLFKFPPFYKGKHFTQVICKDHSVKEFYGSFFIISLYFFQIRFETHNEI